ncbi:MAG: hypothetical protein KA715_07025 [Xanthomonadaceae bacterium]|nr:hypothetical protein [Xanthomonadaceae bacterium]
MNKEIGSYSIPTSPEEQFENILISIRNDLDHAVAARKLENNLNANAPYNATRTQKIRWSLENGKESDINY